MSEWEGTERDINKYEGYGDTWDLERLVKSGNVAAAAKQLEMDTADLESLLKDRDYMSDYEVNQGQQLRHEAAHARQSISEAIETLKAIMRDYDTPAGIKVDAARAIIEAGIDLDQARRESETAAIDRKESGQQAAI